MIFELYSDELIKNWVRRYYLVEANSEKEAMSKIIDGEVDNYDAETLDYYQTPEITEIYNKKGELLCTVQYGQYLMYQKMVILF